MPVLEPFIREDQYTTTYDDEQPTEGLLEEVIAGLPEYENEFGVCSGAVLAYELAGEEEEEVRAISISRFKWKIKHRPGTGYFKAWYRRRYNPEAAGADVLTNLGTYEWTGTYHDADPPTPDGYIYGPATEELEPATDGVNTIEIYKWSCMANYTPPDDGSANGFPVPE